MVSLPSKRNKSVGGMLDVLNAVYNCDNWAHNKINRTYLHQLLVVSPVLRDTVHCSILVSTSLFDRQFGAKDKYSAIYIVYIGGQ